MKSIMPLLLFALISFLSLQAQELPKNLKNEKWVLIMANDSAANFFEADASFQKFYKKWNEEKKKEDASRKDKDKDALEEEHMKDPEEYFVARYFQCRLPLSPLCWQMAA